ncbi:MAG: hypothetical protein AABM29_10320 [Actinomycetota bacterium]
MLATYACAAGICGLSLAAGHLVCRLGGADGWSWLAPGAGLATLLCVATLAVRLPGHGWTALVVLVGLAVAGLAPFLPRLGAETGAQRGDAAGAWEAAAAALIVLAAVSVPFALSGRLGLLGTGINDDLGFHLAWAEALAHGQDADALISQVDPGYPIGPHAVAAAFARPFGVLPAFTGFLMAVPVLTALTALTALGDLRPGWRVAGAAATGLPYMAVSYFAEGSFKEPALALLVLVFALALAELRPPATWRRGLVPGLAAVAAVLTLGRSGVAWPLGILAVWLAAELVARPREWLSWVRGMAPVLLVGAGVLIAGVLANLGRLREATLSGALPDQGSTAGGNFPGQISPWRVFGGWPESDFRLPPSDELWVGIATGIALAAVVYGAAWWTRRRDFAVPAAVLASLIIYWYARDVLAPYFSAKALVVAAPLITLLAVRAAFAGSPEPGHLRRLARSPTDAARALLGVAFLVVVAWSSLLALRNAPVSATDHSDELRSLRPLLRNGPTILLARDDYARSELLGVRLGDLIPYGYRSDVPVRPRPGKPQSPADFDSLTGRDLDRFRYAVTARGPYASAPPGNWRVVRRTRSFEVWERLGPTPRRATLDEGGAPGAILDCASPAGRRLSRRSGVAAVRPAPVVGSADGWRWPGGAAAYLEPSGSALVPAGFAVSQTLRLPPGRWDLSLQYSSPVSLQVRAGELSAHPSAVTEPLSQYWPIGSLTSAGRRVAVEVEVADARLGAIERKTRLGRVVASPANWDVATVPLRDSCGRYVDWMLLD